MRSLPNGAKRSLGKFRISSCYAMCRSSERSERERDEQNSADKRTHYAKRLSAELAGASPSDSEGERHFA